MAGLSQSAVASEVGCKQSALSYFEQGDGTKLNDEAIAKLCAMFHIALPRIDIGRSSISFSAAPAHSGFCPNPHCPSHRQYVIEGKRYLAPDRAAQDPAGGKFCAVCGEVLERRCPNCGAPVHDGAVCSLCGESYVAV